MKLKHVEIMALEDSAILKFEIKIDSIPEDTKMDLMLILKHVTTIVEATLGELK